MDLKSFHLTFQILFTFVTLQALDDIVLYGGNVGGLSEAGPLGD